MVQREGCFSSVSLDFPNSALSPSLLYTHIIWSLFMWCGTWGYWIVMEWGLGTVCSLGSLLQWCFTGEWFSAGHDYSESDDDYDCHLQSDALGSNIKALILNYSVDGLCSALLCLRLIHHCAQFFLWSSFVVITKPNVLVISPPIANPCSQSLPGSI